VCGLRIRSCNKPVFQAPFPCLPCCVCALPLLALVAVAAPVRRTAQDGRGCISNRSNKGLKSMICYPARDYERSGFVLGQGKPSRRNVLAPVK
jgi:hypothetical protein